MLHRWRELMAFTLLCSVKKGLKLMNRSDQLLFATEQRGDVDDVAVLVDRRDFQRVGDDELRRAVLGILLQQFIEDHTRLRRVLVKEILLVGTHSLGTLSARAQGRVE